MPIDPKKRGLASADPDLRKRLAAKGGATKTNKTHLRGFGNPNHPYNRKKNA